MYATTYHIKPHILNWNFEFKLNILKKLSIIKSLNPFVLKGINKELYNVYLVSHALIEEFEGVHLNKEHAVDFHTYSKRCLSKYRVVYSELESSKIFKNRITRELATNTLNNFYTLEGKFRYLVYSKTPNIPNNEEKSHIEFSSKLTENIYA